MDKITTYTEHITAHYPNLQITTSIFNQDGQYNDVLIINNALVFRFAKVPAAIETLRCEIALQQNLREHLSLEIPYPVYANIETHSVGEAFVGYRMIPGTPLWHDNFKAITNFHALGKMARQLAKFLYELHHIDVQTVIPIELPQYDASTEWAGMYRRIQEKLFVYMRPNARQHVTAHFEDFLETQHRYAFEPLLRHGDFGTGNILYDPKRLSIAGILDFGGAGLGDPACDFAGLYNSYGEAFYMRCASIYPEMEHALERVHFYCGTFALQEALFGIENDERNAFKSGIAEYR